MKDAPWLQFDNRFSRAAGGAFPSSLPKVRIDGTTGETWNLCFMRHAPVKLVYTRSAYQSRDLAFGRLALQPTSCRLSARQELKRWPMLKTKLRQDIAHRRPMPASELMRYLASIAMIAAATVVAVGDHPQPVPRVVIPVIIAGVSLGLGPSLCRRYLAR